VDVVHGFERVAGCRVDVAPAVDAIVGDHVDEHAALDRGDAVDARDGLPQRDLDDHRLDLDDAHHALLGSVRE